MVHLGTLQARALGKDSQESGLCGLLGEHLSKEAPALVLRKQPYFLDHDWRYHGPSTTLLGPPSADLWPLHTHHLLQRIPWRLQ